MEIFPNHDKYILDSYRHSSRGHWSGGICVYIKPSLNQFVKRCLPESNIAIYLVISKNVFGFDKDVLLVCAYIPPEGSSFYEKFNTEDNNGITIMEGEILHIFGH